MLQSSLPESFPVSVVMKRTIVTHNIWQSEQWSALGVIVGDRNKAAETENRVILTEEDGEQILFPGYEVTLYKDECESYYYNLLSENPQIYIVSRIDEVDNTLEPILVSASYDEAAAYLETEEEVYTVPIPPELYHWVEAYVLEHYAPEKKKKRKLTDWKEENNPDDPQRGMLQ